MHWERSITREDFRSENTWTKTACCGSVAERTETHSAAHNVLLIFVQTLAYDHRLWTGSERTGSQIRLRFLCRKAGLSLCVWEKSSAISVPVNTTAQALIKHPVQTTSL